LLRAAREDSTAADGREAIADLGEYLDTGDGILPGLLPLWRADDIQRQGDIVQPSTLHMCWALAWRAWYVAWRILENREFQATEAHNADSPRAVLSTCGLLDALEDRWPVVRQMLRRGLPAVDEREIEAALHNETVALLRQPPPAADTPQPILGIKARALMAAIACAPPYWWNKTDEQLAAELENPPPTKAKQKRRRRAPAKEPAPLTPKETEAMQLVGEHKGNFTAAGRAAGKSRQAMQKLYEKACRKLGKSAVEPAAKTQGLPTDHRGQIDVADPDAARRPGTARRP